MNKKLIVILNGLPKSGKEEFAAECGRYFTNSLEYKTSDDPYFLFGEKGLAIKLSSVDVVKQAAISFGWDGKTKTPEIREFLANLKNMATKVFDQPFRYITDTIQEELPTLAFIMAREPKEIKRLVDHYKDTDYEVHVLLIRGKLEEEHNNVADSSVLGYNAYTGHLYNNGTLEQWKQIARNWIDDAFLEKKEPKVKPRFWNKLDKIFGGLTKRIV